MSRFAVKPSAVLFWVAVFFAFFFNMHAIPLFDLDEGAYAETTREMFARGDFIATYMNGLPFFDKPVLFYWLQAATVALFGFNEFAFRLPAALAATGWVWAIFWFVRRVKDEETGYFAGTLAATSVLVSFMGKAGTPDAVLNMIIAATMFAIYLYYLERRALFVLAAYALMGVGFLDKGPIAVIVPGAVSLLFFGIKGQWRAWFKAVGNPLGLALFVVIAAPWYVAQYMREGQAFIDGFFLKHNVGRFTNAMEGHNGSLFYYVPVVLVGVMPFVAPVLKALSRFRELLADDLKLYLILWFLFVFVFFSFSGTKLPHYINYGLTGLLILGALYARDLNSRIWALLPPLLFFVTLLFLPEILTAGLANVKDPYYYDSLRQLDDFFGRGYRLFFIAATGIVLYYMWDARQSIQLKLVASGLLTVFGLSAFVLPAVAEILQQPVKDAALLAKREGYQVVQWHLNMPSFAAYSGQVVATRRPLPGEVVLTSPAYLKELGGYDLLFVQNGIVLARVHAQAGK